MQSILPIIAISDLQRSARTVLSGVHDYAVIRSHSVDVAFVLSPQLGKILHESGMLTALQEKARAMADASSSAGVTEKDIGDLIGNVLRELSKK